MTNIPSDSAIAQALRTQRANMATTKDTDVFLAAVDTLARELDASQGDDDARENAKADFESDYLTDGNGYAPASTYKACFAAFDAGWPDVARAREAALIELERIQGHRKTMTEQRAEFLRSADEADFAAAEDNGPPCAECESGTCEPQPAAAEECAFCLGGGMVPDTRGQPHPEKICRNCNGTGRKPKGPVLAAAARELAEAVGWQVRVYHQHQGRPEKDYWSRWQNISRADYQRTLFNRAYWEYGTYEVRELIDRAAVVEYRLAADKMVELIVGNVCDQAPADPDKPNTVCIEVEELERVIRAAMQETGR